MFFRLLAQAESKTAKKDTPAPKKRITVRAGTNTVTKLVEQKKAQLVVIAHDVDPIEVSIYCIFMLINKFSICNIYCFYDVYWISSPETHLIKINVLNMKIIDSEFFKYEKNISYFAE